MTFNEKEHDYFGKMNALSAYNREKDFTTIDKCYPEYKQWVIENKDRNYREVERELMHELNQLYYNK
jgi:hypothetical protein